MRSAESATQTLDLHTLKHRRRMHCKPRCTRTLTVAHRYGSYNQFHEHHTRHVRVDYDQQRTHKQAMTTQQEIGEKEGATTPWSTLTAPCGWGLTLRSIAEAHSDHDNTTGLVEEETPE